VNIQNIIRLCIVCTFAITGWLYADTVSAQNQVSTSDAFGTQLTQATKALKDSQKSSLHAELLKDEFKAARALLDQSKDLLKKGRKDESLTKAREAIVLWLTPIVSDGLSGGALTMFERQLFIEGTMAAETIEAPQRSLEVTSGGSVLFSITIGRRSNDPTSNFQALVHRYAIATTTLDDIGGVASLPVAQLVMSPMWKDLERSYGSRRVRLVRNKLIQILGRVGDEGAIPVLKEIIATEPPLSDYERAIKSGNFRLASEIAVDFDYHSSAESALKEIEKRLRKSAIR
jgi:hypothetical protein